MREMGWGLRDMRVEGRGLSVEGWRLRVGWRFRVEGWGFRDKESDEEWGKKDEGCGIKHKEWWVWEEEWDIRYEIGEIRNEGSGIKRREMRGEGELVFQDGWGFKKGHNEYATVNTVLFTVFSTTVKYSQYVDLSFNFQENVAYFSIDFDNEF